MPVIIPVDYVQANVILALDADSEPIVNTFGLHLTDASNASVALANSVMLEYAAAWQGLISSQYQVMQCVLYGFNGLGPSEVIVSTEAPVRFINDVGPLPQNCAALVRKRTDMAGRRGRGRMYLPGIQEASVSPTGIISGALLAQLQPAADDFLAGLEAIVGVEGMVVLHRSEGAGVEPAPTPVVSLQVDERIATQRRRLRP